MGSSLKRNQRTWAQVNGTRVTWREIVAAIIAMALILSVNMEGS